VTAPYYEADGITLYHGDCLEVTEWLAADVLVTDPPYGRQWRQGDTASHFGWRSNRNDVGIANDHDTATRDRAITQWGSAPAIVFGDLMLAPPANTKHVLIYDKNDGGVIGAVGGFRRSIEAIYLVGTGWGSSIGGRSAVLTARASMGGNYARKAGHPHAKPLDVLSTLIEACPPGTIADPFAGSGSTLLAARNLGRQVIGVEIEERYCELIARRLAQTALFTSEAAL
jgi:site-specific DNA-methyltransferase (adenine-specific)